MKLESPKAEKGSGGRDGVLDMLCWGWEMLGLGGGCWGEKADCGGARWDWGCWVDGGGEDDGRVG